MRVYVEIRKRNIYISNNFVKILATELSSDNSHRVGVAKLISLYHLY